MTKIEVWMNTALKDGKSLLAVALLGKTSCPLHAFVIGSWLTNCPSSSPHPHGGSTMQTIGKKTWPNCHNSQWWWWRRRRGRFNPTHPPSTREKGGSCLVSSWSNRGINGKRSQTDLRYVRIDWIHHNVIPRRTVRSPVRMSLTNPPEFTWCILV